MSKHRGVISRVILAAGIATVAASYSNADELTIRDYTGRGFPPDLVEYRVRGTARDVRRLRVVDADGNLVPSQIRTVDEDGAARLLFVTELPADSTATFSVQPGGGRNTAGAVGMRADGQHLVVSNQLFSIRLPGPREETFDPPVPAATLPAPVLGFRHADGAWLGGGAILSRKPVRSLRVQAVLEGSVCTEVVYEIQWAEGGYYRATFQVIDRVPLAKVYEEYDLGILDGTHFWELDLARGWQPDRAQTASHHGNGAGDPVGRIVDFPGLMRGQPVQYLVGDQAWGRLSHLGVFRAADSEASPRRYPLVGVVPLRKGLWRRSNAMEVHSANAHDMRVRFPMGVRHALWQKDITSETSPFSTQEHDPNLPETYGRRVWGLALGHPAIPDAVGDKPVYQLQRLYGIIGLDRYKDFVLEWPESADLAYPRLFDTERPAAPPEDQSGLAALRRLCTYYFTSPHASHHGTSANYMIAAQADAMLAHPDLPAATRTEIRARLALLCHLYADADMMSYGNGHHHGNPNMGTARFWSGPTFLALIPDHSMFAGWREHMADYGAFNFATQIAPGGSYVEFGAAYHMHGFARATYGLAGLHSAGAAQVDPMIEHYVAPDWRYYMNLLTPYDSRWRSRVVPGLANSQPGNSLHFIEAAGMLAGHDPELAAHLAWAWQANGARGGAHPDLAALAPPPVEPRLSSQIYPGMGVIFRAHQGPEETYMLFRAGFQWSHWTVDPGHFILMSKGAVLVPYQPFQYGGPSDPSFDWHNTIRFGHPENVWPHSWGDSAMLDHAFGDSVDYAWASTGFPDWFVEPGISPRWQALQAPDATGPFSGPRNREAAEGWRDGAFEWNRQIMFMKGKTATSPNYFVIRDSVTGDGRLPSYLYLNVLGTEDAIAAQAGGLTVGTEWPTRLDVLFAHPEAVAAPAMHAQRMPMALHGGNLGERVGAPGTVSPNWVQADGTPWEGVPRANQTHENRVMLRIPGAPGRDWFWLLYPRGEGEAEPEITRLGEGAMKITHAEGVDYVFLGSEPIAFEGEDVVFQGRAGAVRLLDDTVVLVKAGGDGRVGYGARVIEGNEPMEARLARNHPQPGAERRPAPLDAIAPPPVDNAETELTPGVWRGILADGSIRYRLPSRELTRYTAGNVHLEGGGVMVEVSDHAVRFVASQDGYVKLAVGARGIRGFGPFDLTFTDSAITGEIAGRTRSLVTTWPQDITRPMFLMDGRRYFAGWADDHSIGKGTDSPQFSIGFGVTAGRHAVAITEWQYPELPAEPERRAVQFQPRR